MSNGSDAGRPRPDPGPAYRSTYERVGKPLLDRIIGIILGLLTLPAILPLAVLSIVLLEGPLIAQSQRIGRRGSEFTLYKLNTEPAAASGARSRFARFLRQWSFDELPQLWNILKGDMSLVGPRPITPKEAAELDDWQLRRHDAKPGLTGLWQVEARGDNRTLQDNIHYDIQYLDRMSLATDLWLLTRTFATLLTRREGTGAAGNARWRSRYPHLRLVATDLLAWTAALTIAALGRLDFNWTLVDKTGLAVAALIAVVTQLTYGYVVGLYRGRWSVASYEEIGWLASGTALVTGTLLFSTFLTTANLVPRGATLAAGAFQLVGAAGARYFASAIYAAQGRSIHRRPYKMLVFGAGDAGRQATEAIWHDRDSDALPVAFLDDDPHMWKRRPLGLPVVGGRESVVEAARRYNADILLIAIPSANPAVIDAVATAAQQAQLRVRILPRLAKFVDGSDGAVLTSDIRDLNLADFLNREETRLDLEEIAKYLEGKKVLITGAGGSIGSVLCRIVDQFDPKQVFKLDHDENALHGLQLATEGKALLDSDELVLCDIRDRNALFDVFRRAEPEVVFHTAAHKHVTFMERYPQEAIKTNVLGTLNVLEAAHEFGVDRFVNISTDKAATPTSVLGQTKRAAEMLTAHFDAVSSTTFLSVRFGNVLGSKGSVIPTFSEQIKNGEPITVTDPDVTRYFMTIEEACRLVVQAGAVGGHGDVYVLDMGEPIRIVELARRLAAVLRPSDPTRITYTGLRSGEKLHEVLAGPEETLVDRPHELLSRYVVPPLDPTWFNDELDIGRLSVLLGQAG